MTFSAALEALLLASSRVDWVFVTESSADLLTISVDFFSRIRHYFVSIVLR
jgi:hypothetical protein